MSVFFLNIVKAKISYYCTREYTEPILGGSNNPIKWSDKGNICFGAADVKLKPSSIAGNSINNM